jgi:hypothetical protein
MIVPAIGLLTGLGTKFMPGLDGSTSAMTWSLATYSPRRTASRESFPPVSG